MEIVSSCGPSEPLSRSPARIWHYWKIELKCHVIKRTWRCHLRNRIWVIIVYRLINNGLEFWCVGINNADRRPKWSITSIRTPPRCLWAVIWRHFIFYVGSNMINNEIEGYNRLLLLAHVYSRFTSAESEQPETRTYKYRSCQKVVPLYIG